MASAATVWLAVAATALGGILAGGSFDRAVVQLPAWQRLGAGPWAAYSRLADLRVGVVLYPIVGLGAPILSLAAAAAFFLGGGEPRGAAIPLVSAAALSVGHVFTTSRAAPNMLRLRHTDDPDIVQRSLSGFERWSAPRAALQVLTFAANLWALVAVLGP